jgi:hypothetical protein
VCACVWRVSDDLPPNGLITPRRDVAGMRASTRHGGEAAATTCEGGGARLQLLGGQRPGLGPGTRVRAVPTWRGHGGGHPWRQGEQGSALGTCARPHARWSKAARRTASTVAPRHAGGAIRRGSIRGEQRLRLGGPAEAMRTHAVLRRTRAAVWPHKARQRWVRNGDGGLRVVARWRHSDPCTRTHKRVGGT